MLAAQAAEEDLEAGHSDVVASSAVATSSAVTAGINACDALSRAPPGQRAGGEHSEAVDLLDGAAHDGRQAARQLSQLLRQESPAQYDPAPMPEGATEAVALACRLVDPTAQGDARRGPRSLLEDDLQELEVTHGGDLGPPHPDVEALDQVGEMESVGSLFTRAVFLRMQPA